MTKRKGQEMSYKTLHRKLNIAQAYSQQTGGELKYSGRAVFLTFFYIRIILHNISLKRFY
jgi:hypothetical protein